MEKDNKNKIAKKELEDLKRYIELNTPMTDEIRKEKDKIRDSNFKSYPEVNDYLIIPWDNSL